MKASDFTEQAAKQPSKLLSQVLVLPSVAAEPHSQMAAWKSGQGMGDEQLSFSAEQPES